MTEAQKIARAERRVRAMTGFYIHLAVFVGVMALLFVLNMTDTEWWVQWPFLGWGVGILGHALTVFGSSPGIVARWEQRKIEALKRSLDASEPVVGEVPKPLVTATTELPIVDRTAR